MKYSKKVIVALNADKEKYLNNVKSTNRDLFINVCVRCHDNKVLSSFGIPKKSTLLVVVDMRE
jgi:cytochrome c553